ncbi:MAG TPA: hypothetical protein VF613_20865, partial [Longimicrobium sp.]
MTRLVQEITSYIEDQMRAAARTLQGPGGALRSVFHGPPLPFLEPILERLTAGSGLAVTLGDSEDVIIPVLIPVDQLPEAAVNPPVGASGYCDASYLLALRNTPACPRFLTLAAPARHHILSVAQATAEFGLSSDNNSGSAAANEWWSDDFIQHLVNHATAHHAWRDENERNGAHELLEAAVGAADEGDRHDPQRPHGWAALSRALSITDPQVPFGLQWSCACGFPPVADGRIDAKEQVRVLGELMAAIVDEGYTPCAERLKRNATEEEQAAISECFRHLQTACEVPLALTRAASFYYAPSRADKLGHLPAWWAVLTTERLAELLEQEGGEPAGTVEIQCTNSIVSPGRGLPAVVMDHVELSIGVPTGSLGASETTIVREAGARSNQREWQLQVVEKSSLTDDAPPLHKLPIRFVVSAAGVKKSAMRVVSLAHWEPGIVVAARTATKIKLPRRARSGSKHTLECELVLAGEGRHLLDLHVAPNVGLPERVRGEDSSTTGAEALDGAVSLAVPGSGGPAGLEVEATAECYYDLDFTRPDGTPERLRIHLTCDDAPTEGCRSEFERLIRLNRSQERPRAAADIQIDRQVRVADLQAWALAPQVADRSFYPLVLASDCRERWRAPSWLNAEDTILSRGRFLHDPRPPLTEMHPPQEFIEARTAILQRIRGKEDHGLIEAAELGIWMGDREFADCVERYVRSYMRWLEEDPGAAAWADLVLVFSLETDDRTLAQEPDAVLVSPLHPVRLGWHSLAQRALWEAWRAGQPCPAGSILDPDSVPDALSLPLRMPSGLTKQVTFLATECSSDYWAVLWNGNRIDRLVERTDAPPFDEELGIRLGGVSSGFSVSQVRRSLDDVGALLAAKPVLNVAVASKAGHSDACNDGIMSWARDRFAERDGVPLLQAVFGTRHLQVFDERKSGAQPEEAAVANLTEDTSGAVKWFSRIPPETKPDLGIIAQLETSNAAAEKTERGSPLGIGALVRHRVRTQLSAGSGAFLSESRMGVAGPPSGDGLADTMMRTVALLENLGEVREGYTFAPSVQAIQAMFAKRAEYVAVSSSAVDPACFLGGWLDGVYLWDYELPSYSHRAGDTNGYYLLSGVKPLDCEALQRLLARLPGCDALGEDVVRGVLLEVARRGIPTVRGLSSGHSGATGDLGLFLAGRLLQDDFRSPGASIESILPVFASDGEVHEVSLVVPVDPFRGYLLDLQRSLGTGQFLRPDLVVASIVVTDSAVRCRITPVEVKYRRDEVMHVSTCRDALGQAGALSTLLGKLEAQGKGTGPVIWKLTFQHLLVSMLDFGFRVYSQQLAAMKNPGEWSRLHHAVIAAILSDEAQIQIDGTGRLIVFDASMSSAPRDMDGDGFKETIVLSAHDAASIMKGDPSPLYEAIRNAIADWRLRPIVEPLGGATGTKENINPAGAGERHEEGTIPRVFTTTKEVREDAAPPYAAPAPAPDRVDEVPSHGVEDEVRDQTQARPDTPGGSDGVRVLVGSTVDDFSSEPKFLRPNLTALNQLNMGVVGDLGTGKTQLVKSLVYQISRAAALNGGVKPRFLIFDYKKDYSAADFVNAVGARVVKPHELPLNLFDVSGVTSGAAPWLDRFKFFADVLDKIYSNVGPVQRENLKQAVRSAYQDCSSMSRQPTIYDVYDRYRAHVQGKVDAPLSIIGDLVDMELFARDPGGAANFDTFLDGVVVLSLDSLGQDDRTKNMLVA